MAIEEAEDSDGGEEEEKEDSRTRTAEQVAHRPHRARRQSLSSSWVGEPRGKHAGKTYYR